MMQRGFAPLLLLIALVVLVGIGGGAYVVISNQSSQPDSQEDSLYNSVDYSGPYSNSDMGFGITVPVGWAYYEDYSSAQYQYFSLYEEDVTYDPNTTKQQELWFMTQSHSMQPCDRDACTELPTQKITVGSREYEAEFFSSGNASGGEDYKSFRVTIPQNDDDSVTILGFYHTNGEFQELIDILSSFTLAV
ncbi:hypothetical protein KC571_04265 [candidate division WWE3 bacterium]|uniref:Uncharacterized protein n=1 Tax=candidate division WWE3 bacterium TaxID=2053526 RepID=A0A955LHY2_UNCKA|nr:hypothetical protein [candidate division WWE3 bacterium]